MTEILCISNNNDLPFVLKYYERNPLAAKMVRLHCYTVYLTMVGHH